MRRRAAGAGLLAALLAMPAAAAPLPPPRPPAEAEPAPPAPVPAPAPTAEAPVGGTGAGGACLVALKAAGHAVTSVAQPAGTGPSPAGTGTCGVEEPVAVERLGAVALPDRPVLACAVVPALAEWVVGVVQPVLERSRGAPLLAIRTGPGYECRPRNRRPGAPPSAHGNGLALDLAGFQYRDGVETIGPDLAAKAPFAAIRRAACGWFTTVLGPGSDSDHATHLHVDTLLHGRSDRYRICQ